MGMIVNIYIYIYMIFPNAQALQLPLGSLVPVLEVEIPRRSPRMPEVREVHCMNQTMKRYEKIWEAELKPEIRRQVFWATHAWFKDDSGRFMGFHFSFGFVNVWSIVYPPNLMVQWSIHLFPDGLQWGVGGTLVHPIAHPFLRFPDPC